MTTPLAIDLFSGAGGLSEGLEKAGIRIGLAQELHPHPASTLAFNHSNTPVLVGDIRNINMAVMRDLLLEHHNTADVDVVVGGPPCQGFSTAGKKNKSDPRNNLFSSFCDVVAEFSPKVVLLENVPGFKKMYGGEIFREAKDQFTKLGYRCDDRLLTATGFGLPQRRQRFVMVGIRSDIGSTFAWPDPSHKVSFTPSNDLFEGSLLAPVTVMEALSDLSFLKPGFEANFHTLPAESDYQLSRRSDQQLLFNHLASAHREKTATMFSHIQEGRTISDVPEELRSAKRTMARLDRNGISNTVLALPDDLIHYEKHRIPTVREMARLQGFDDDFVFLGKRTTCNIQRRRDVPQYTQVGNAVPPILAEALGLSIVKFLGSAAQDLRNLPERRLRHSWLRGTSGSNGYVLSSGRSLPMFDPEKNLINLPIDDDQPLVADRPEVLNWKARPKSKPLAKTA